MNLKIIKNYKSYFLVFFIFIFIFIFGKSMNVLTPEQRKSQDQAYAQKKIASGIYSVPSDQNQYILNSLFSVKKGQCGRLFFGLRNTVSDNNLTELFMGNSKIKISLSNNFYQNQEIGSYEMKSDGFAQNVITEFCADADYSNLIFQKDEDSKDSSFEISNVLFYSLFLKKYDLSNLLTSIIGNTDLGKIIYQSNLNSKSAVTAFKFTRHNQMIGQTFVADSNTISGVDLKLDFTGSGGIGNYFLELREVGEENQEMSLSSDRIAYYCFNKDTAERDLKIEKGFYHIPLVANLEQGKTYFIGISNEAVKFNILNTLKVYGGTAGNDQDKITTSIGGKVISKPGNLYLKVYGADYVMLENEKVLTGAKILDNGDGTGLYLYEQRGSSSDYLDLYQSTMEKNKNVFFDSVQSGVAGRDVGDNNFIYKINTLYPFTKFKINAEQTGGGYTDSLLYYSFNNINWYEIKNNFYKEGENKDEFQELIQGGRETKTIYIKATFNKDDAKGKSIHLFGLKNLKIVAELAVKN